MKSFILLFLIFFAPAITFAQQNLVPNPSFEDTVYCPFQLGELDACAEWMNWGQSPDYFNVCSSGGSNVPNSVIGFQYANSGNAFVGLVTYAMPGPPGGPNGREIIASQLLAPLVTGTKYFVSFYVNFPYDLLPIATNNTGVLFTNIAYNVSNPPPLPNHSQLYTNKIITDSINWIKISGSFIADSAYSYIMLGNFFDDTHTDTLILTQFPYAAYYYIDDVCVSTDSLYNELWTGLQQNNFVKNEIIISPNPADNEIRFKLKNPTNQIKITISNILGERILEKQYTVENNEITLNSTLLTNGLYLIAIDLGNNNIEYRKILIQH